MWGVGRQIANAEVIYVLRAQVDGVRSGIGLLVLKVKFSTVDKVVGVVGPAVLIVSFGESEKHRTQSAQRLVRAVGLLVGFQREAVVLNEVDHTFRLVGNGRRRPEIVGNCDLPDPADEAIGGNNIAWEGLAG